MHIEKWYKSYTVRIYECLIICKLYTLDLKMLLLCTGEFYERSRIDRTYDMMNIRRKYMLGLKGVEWLYVICLWTSILLQYNGLVPWYD